jgi:hypothetical protein
MLVLSGCDSPPRGKDSGRVPVTDTTKAETKSRKPLIASLYEFSEQVPQQLAGELASIPQIRDHNGRVVVLVGDIANKTDIVSSNEFELVRSRIRNRLLQSGFVKEKIQFVENRARMENIAAREGVTVDLNRTYDPATTFALSGDFYRLQRGGGEVNAYYMEFQLVHFASNEIVFSNSYDVKQLEKD